MVDPRYQPAVNRQKYQTEELSDIRSLLGPAAYNQMMSERVKELSADTQTIETNMSDPVDWIERNFWIPELKGPIKIEPYQKRCLREAFRRDSNGLFVYTTVVWADIKKSIKSTIAAAATVWRAFAVPYAQCVCVANDLRQANSRVLFYINRAFALNPAWREIKPIKYRVNLPNGSYIEAVAIDPTGEAGGNPDFVVFSELWGSHQDAQQAMWTEMTIPPTKFGLGIRWVETYAGHSGESPTLERLYETGVKQGRLLWPDETFSVTGGNTQPLQAYANDAARQFTLWNSTPRMSWQTPDYYSQQAIDLTPKEFRRVHRNEWVSSNEKFVPDEWWDPGCKHELKDRAPLDKQTKVVLAVDAAVSNDCFGLLGVRRDPLDLLEGVEVVYARKWDPKILGSKIDYDEPEKEIRRLCATYNVVQICYDEFQLHNMATRLTKEGLAWFFQFSQTKPRAIADKQLFDLIRDRKIRHYGESDLSDHLQNANAESTDDKKLRLVKRADNKKIDLAVCLSMASHECLRLNLV